jgi:dCTP deaminase
VSEERPSKEVVGEAHPTNIMGASILTLFPELENDLKTFYTTGILPSQTIEEFVSAGYISADGGISSDQIQPASVDLRLGPVAYRIRASFLPSETSTVLRKVEELKTHEIDLEKPAVLERGCVYVVPLMEEVHLPQQVSGKANPKSTVGRLDVFTRLMTDYGNEFERVPAGYSGRLYAEIAPRTFSISVHAGTRLNQLRFMRGSPAPSDRKLTELHESEALLYVQGEAVGQPRIANGLWISVDLEGNEESETIGYLARRHAPLVNMDSVDHYDPAEFWEPIFRRRDKPIILNPDDFYIFASREKIRVPAGFAAEMVGYDPTVGEFRIHYAGFFDPGFGYGHGEVMGSRAVLEVRSHGVPFLLEHGQRVGRLIFERLLGEPHKVYGEGIGSSYQGQGLALSKQFRRTQT